MALGAIVGVKVGVKKMNRKASRGKHMENKAKENWKSKNKLNHESFYNFFPHGLDDAYLKHLCSLVEPNYNISYSDFKTDIKGKSM